MRKVMVFGVFDGLHDGHRAFLRAAKQEGDYLIAVVAQDHIVAHLKGRLPKINVAERFSHLEKEDAVDEVVIGDARIGTYGVVKKCHPHVIALGYDQHALKADLERSLHKFGWPLELKVMEAYKPERYHSRLLRN